MAPNSSLPSNPRFAPIGCVGARCRLVDFNDEDPIYRVESRFPDGTAVITVARHLLHQAASDGRVEAAAVGISVLESLPEESAIREEISQAAQTEWGPGRLALNGERVRASKLRLDLGSWAAYAVLDDLEFLVGSQSVDPSDLRFVFLPDLMQASPPDGPK